MGRVLKVSAWAIVAVTLACAVLIVTIAMADRVTLARFILDYSLPLSLGLSFVTISALVLSRRSTNLVSWLFLASGFFACASSAAYEWGRHAVMIAPGSLPSGGVATWIASWTWYFQFAFAVLALALFPHGTLPGRRWRWIIWLLGLQSTAFLASAVLLWNVPARLVLDMANDTTGLPHVALIPGATFSFIFIPLAGATAGIVSRFLRSGGEERAQLRWLIWAGSINLVTALIPEGVAPLPIAVVNGLAIVLLAASIGVAISRYRLYEIDRVIRRTFIYAFVTGILAVSYAGLVLLIGMASPLGSDSPIAVAVATLAVAGLFRPLRLLVQKSIDRYSTELVTTLSVHWSSSATGCERTSTSTRWGPS